MLNIVARLGNSVWFRWSVALALLGAVVLVVDVEKAAGQLREVRPELAIPALLGLVGVQLVGAATWAHLSKRLCGVELGLGLAARAYYASLLIGGLTPANVGSDVYRLRAMRMVDVNWKDGLLPIVAQRLASLVTMATLGAAAAMFIPISMSVRIGIVSVLAGGVLAVALPWIIGALPSSMRRPPGKLPIPDGIHSFTPKVAFEAGALALALHASSIVLILALLMSLTSDGEVAPLLATLTVARAATLLPLAPGSLGTQEAALVLLVPLAGPDPAAAAALAMLLRLGMLLTFTAGFACIVWPDRLRPTLAVSHGSG